MSSEGVLFKIDNDCCHFDSCITATLTLLFFITTPSSVSLLPITFALSCRTLNVLSSLFLSVGGVGVGGGVEQWSHV